MILIVKLKHNFNFLEKTFYYMMKINNFKKMLQLEFICLYDF